MGIRGVGTHGPADPAFAGPAFALVKIIHWQLCRISIAERLIILGVLINYEY